MSDIKQKSKQLKDLCKKYGYEVKHTHALEIISQLEDNTNRHVALGKEKKSSFMGLSFQNAPIGVNTPFYQAYVLEVTSLDELVNFIVIHTDEPFLDAELLNEFTSSIVSMRFMTEKEVSKPGFSFRIEEEDEPVPFNTLLSWIEHRAKQTKEATFIVSSID